MTDNPDLVTALSADPVAALRQMGRGSLVERMQIELEEASADRVVATMPVAGNTQVTGILHGGASCVLAETIGSIGAFLHANASNRIAVGIEINTSHHRSVSAGTVRGTALPLMLGSSLASYEIVITDDAGRRVSTTRLTCALLDPR